MNLKKHNELISLLNEEITLLIEIGPPTADQQSKIKDIGKKLGDLEKQFSVVTQSPYDFVEITFYGETKLTLRARSQKFERTLKGDMYFTVVNYNGGERFIDLQTRSFPEELALRLHFNKLETGRDQRGKIQLVYDRKYSFKNVERNHQSKEVTLSFKFRKLT